MDAAYDPGTILDLLEGFRNSFYKKEFSSDGMMMPPFASRLSAFSLPTHSYVQVNVEEESDWIFFAEMYRTKGQDFFVFGNEIGADLVNDESEILFEDAKVYREYEKNQFVYDSLGNRYFRRHAGVYSSFGFASKADAAYSFYTDDVKVFFNLATRTLKQAPRYAFTWEKNLEVLSSNFEGAYILFSQLL
jgi:hypothetical protein